MFDLRLCWGEGWQNVGRVLIQCLQLVALIAETPPPWCIRRACSGFNHLFWGFRGLRLTIDDMEDSGVAAWSPQAAL